MNHYIPLNVHSHYSLLLGLSKPSDISARCKELNIPACAITDEGTMSGVVSFYKEMTNNKIKPIIGCKLYISLNDKISKIIVLCKNKQGWDNLISLVSLSNSQDRFNKVPILYLEDINNIAEQKNLICITGFHNSTLWDCCTKDNKIIDSYQEEFNKHISILEEIFGSNHLFVQIDMFNNYYNQIEIAKLFKELCKNSNIKTLAGIESYYTRKDDSVDQRVLLCSKLKTTLPDISKKMLDGHDTGYNHFFEGDMFHLLDYDTINSLYDKEDIDNTILVNELCESFNPLNKPVLPKFNFPSEFKSDTEYLRQLCRNGWRDKISNNIPKDKQQVYVDRIKYELSVLEEANLSSYFLIVRDIVRYVKDKKLLAGPGRGSAAGCLVSYLIDITSIDPIKYNLLFERFYNAGRNTKDRISMPDIDVDVPIDSRDDIIEYIKDRYGHNKVSQMITFNTLKGRGALKEVLRVYNNLTFEEMNNITKHIPDEAKIADELQEIKEEDGSASIIRWALENDPNKFKDWCSIDDNGQLIGPLAKRFEQAIRIEGTKCHQSKHAAGIAIAAEPLQNICPVIFDQKTGQNIAGLEMNDLDALGVIKFDILGIALLDKIMYVNQLLNKGDQL